MQNLKFYLFLLILGVIFTSCEKDDPTVIDPTLSFPSILSASVTPNSFDTTYLNAVIKAKVASDLPISKVTANILNPGSLQLISIDLKDDGVSPDTAAGDGIYTARLNLQLDCKLVGSYTVQIVAENSSGLNSGPSNVTFAVTNINNRKPFLTDLICPTDLRRPTGIGADTETVVFLQAKGNDPDGNCDVKSVFFNSFNPNGFPNAGNPFALYDDGDKFFHGDTVAGDFKFSLKVALFPNPSDTSIGNFTFKFNASDQQNLLSDTLTRIINIHR